AGSKTSLRRPAKGRTFRGVQREKMPAQRETICERRRRSALRVAGQPLFFQPDPDRLYVDLLLRPMEPLVADAPPVAKRDEGASLGGERLVPEPAKGRLAPSRVGA